MSRRWPWLAALVFLGAACNTSTKDFFAPSVAVAVTLPGELPPLAVPCLDLVVSSAEGQPAQTSVGFGAGSALIKVQTLDLNGDGRLETRIRYTQGSTPFFTDTTTFRLSLGSAVAANTAFTIDITTRLADGAIADEDRCLGGTELATGRVDRDRAGQPLRFPSTGELTVPITLTCGRVGGCAIEVPDGGASATDAGVTVDAGAPDGGAVVSDGGAADGGVVDGGIKADGGAQDGGR